MKTLSLGVLIFCLSHPVLAKDSLYPLKCGTYLVTAHVQKGTPQMLELVVAKGTEAETILKATFPENRTPKFFFENKNILVTGKLKLTRKTHPYTLEGTWLSSPMTEKYRKTDWVVLKESL
ncbi:MAG: hypothetical protein HYY62_00985, partial [Deltaproteobacteria bacterium]|nr:hypothetical protein [Deltaproteobacteria bacterium]